LRDLKVCILYKWQRSEVSTAKQQHRKRSRKLAFNCKRAHGVVTKWRAVHTTDSISDIDRAVMKPRIRRRRDGRTSILAVDRWFCYSEERQRLRLVTRADVAEW